MFDPARCRFGEVAPREPRRRLIEWQAHPGTHTEPIEEYIKRLQENPGLRRPWGWSKSDEDLDA